MQKLSEESNYSWLVWIVRSWRANPLWTLLHFPFSFSMLIPRRSDFWLTEWRPRLTYGWGSCLHIRNIFTAWPKNSRHCLRIFVKLPFWTKVCHKYHTCWKKGWTCLYRLLYFSWFEQNLITRIYFLQYYLNASKYWRSPRSDNLSIYAMHKLHWRSCNVAKNLHFSHWGERQKN